MAVLERTSDNENVVDDSLPLSCVFDNYRLVDGHTEYIIKVQRGYSGGKSWTVFKRFKEFVALDKELHASTFDINLPPKKLIGNLNRQFIVQRQNQLQNYMNKILSNLILSSSIPLKKFLDPENYNSSFEDAAFQYASMALRGKPDFHNLKMLQNIGWRFKKQYCTVKRLNEAKREYILTWISEYGITRCLSDKELQSAFKVLRELKHSFIVPIVTGNCYSSGTLIIRPSCIRGSLRDLIYDKSPFSNFIQKCRYRSERLIMPSNAVSTIAVQVLHALAYLHKKKIPYGNLHSGNVFIDDNVAKISDIENGIFGLASFYKPYLIENRRIQSLEDADMYCFGHVLYEMAFGERLQSCCCDTIPSDCYDNLRPLLELLLSSSPKLKLPSASAMLSSEAFSLCSSSIVFDEPPRCKITANCKELFRRCQTTIENRLHSEQNELRKIRKLSHLQELMETEEKYECASTIKEKRKMKKTASQCSLGTSNVEHSENISNVSNISTTTTVSTDSSSPNFSGCDKSNGKISETDVVDDLAKPSLGKETSDERTVFLRSIVNFNKHNLRKTKAKDETPFCL